MNEMNESMNRIQLSFDFAAYFIWKKKTHTFNTCECDQKELPLNHYNDRTITTTTTKRKKLNWKEKMKKERKNIWQKSGFYV